MNFKEAFADELQKTALLEEAGKGIGYVARGVKRFLQGFQAGRKVPPSLQVTGTTPGARMGLVAGSAFKRLLEAIKSGMKESR
jgi:hypothetical protein